MNYYSAENLEITIEIIYEKISDCYRLKCPLLLQHIVSDKVPVPLHLVFMG